MMDLKWERRYKRRRAIIWITILVLLVINVNLGIYPDPDLGDGCISISFDKVPLLLADRIVVRQGHTSYEITDRALIWDLVTESRIPTNTQRRHTNDNRWIDIYCGELLVRSIRWAINADGDVFVVYEPDLLHWLFPWDLGDAQVTPSAALIARLNAACQ